MSARSVSPAIIVIVFCLCALVFFNGQTYAQEPSLPPRVVSLTLVDAVTDQDIATFTGGVINCTALATKKLNMRANTVPKIVGSVRFALDDNPQFNIENDFPYSLAKDIDGDYKVWTPTNGDHTISAIPYTLGGGFGTAGISLTVTFSVKNCAEPQPPGTPDATETSAAATASATPTATPEQDETPDSTPLSTATVTSTPTNTIEVSPETPTFTPTFSGLTATPTATLSDPDATSSAQTATSAAVTATSVAATDIAATQTAAALTATATPTPTPETIELLVNGGFETDSNNNNQPDNWIVKNLSRDRMKCNKSGKPPVAYSGMCMYQFRGLPGERSLIGQNIDPAAFAPLVLNAGDRLTLSGFSNAKGKVSLKIKVRVRYLDTTQPIGKINLTLNTVVPEYAPFTGNLSLVLTGQPSSIRLRIANRSTSGRVRLDALSLTLTNDVLPLLPVEMPGNGNGNGNGSAPLIPLP
jgi:hypothetical protein